MGGVHGGTLMVFADFAFCAIGLIGSDDDHIMTVSLTTDFVRSAPVGAWLESRAELTRRTGSLVFLTGQITHEGDVLLNYTGVGKRIQDS
jgi:acyl-coenzyme A thioesterase PaaI-like protein